MFWDGNGNEWSVMALQYFCMYAVLDWTHYLQFIYRVVSGTDLAVLRCVQRLHDVAMVTVSQTSLTTGYSALVHICSGRRTDHLLLVLAFRCLRLKLDDLLDVTSWCPFMDWESWKMLRDQQLFWAAESCMAVLSPAWKRKRKGRVFI